MKETTTPMTTTNALQNPPKQLNRSDAILRILEVWDEPEERLILEGLAYLATTKPWVDVDCRILRTFDKGRSGNWLLDTQESIAYLQEMGWVEIIRGLYALTEAGRTRLNDLERVYSPHLPDYPFMLTQEAERIKAMKEIVHERLGI